jgi:hypothetical protein
MPAHAMVAREGAYVRVATGSPADETRSRTAERADGSSLGDPHRELLRFGRSQLGGRPLASARERKRTLLGALSKEVVPWRVELRRSAFLLPVRSTHTARGSAGALVLRGNLPLNCRKCDEQRSQNLTACHGSVDRRRGVWQW